MLHGVYSVRDRAVACFLPPFFMPADGAAIRSFLEAASDAQHQFAKHKEDYSLWKLATWDDASGRFENLQDPVFLVGAGAEVNVNGGKNAA